MDSLIFSHSNMIRAATIINELDILIVTDQYCEVFDVGITKYKAKKLLMPDFGDLQPINIISSKTSDKQYLIQGKMGICIIIQIIYLQNDQCNIQFLKKINIGMIGFIKINPFLLTFSVKQRLKQQQGSKNGIKIQKKQTKKSLLSESLKNKVPNNTELQCVQQIGLQNHIEAFVAYDERDIALNILQLKTGNVIHSFCLQQPLLSEFAQDSLTCMLPLPLNHQQQTILPIVLGKQSGKIALINIYRENTIKLLSQVKIVPISQQSLITDLVAIMQQQTAILICTVRKNPCFHIIRISEKLQMEIVNRVDTAILGIQKVPITIKNLIYIRNQLFYSIDRKLYCTKFVQLLRKPPKEVSNRRLAQLYQSKNIISIEIKRQTLVACTSERQFIFMTIE